MKQEERDKILGRRGKFDTSNIPISVWQVEEGEDKGKFYPVVAMPRKEACYNCYETPFETEEEFQEFCDAAIAMYENAVELFKLLKEHKIDHIYYFDSPEEYLKKMNKKDEGSL